MKTNYLFPNKYKAIGWILFIPSLILGIISLFIDIEPNFLDFKVFSVFSDNIFDSKDGVFFDFIDDNIFNELLGIALIISSLLVAFSKEKEEDEYIIKIRLESLVWAVYINYIILFVSILIMHDFTFLRVMMINLFSTVIVFIIKFHLELKKLKNIANNEE